MQEPFSSHIYSFLLFLVFLVTGGTAPAQKSAFLVPSNNCPRSQKNADIWYFGEHAGIDFRSGTAVPLTDQNVMTAYKSSAVMSDSTGNLLLFTNSNQAWDRSFNLIPGADTLDGDQLVGQSCIIVPVPENPDRYLIFTIDVLKILPDNTYTTKGLTYTIIDMSLNNGMGEAVKDKVNLPLLSPVCQKITAVYNEPAKTYWVLVHKWDSDEFYAFPVTKDGPGTPVISSSGTSQGGGFVQQNNALGYMKFSPDGKRVALAISGLNQVELFNFNDLTGDVSGAQSYVFTKPGVSPYGLDFSPDNKMLYVSLLQLTGNGAPSYPSYICQFNLSSGLANPVFIDSVPGMRVGALQLATDGRIYGSRTVNLAIKKDSLVVIYNPTRPGTNCNFNLLNNVPQSLFGLSGRVSIYSLPNFIQTYVNIPVFTYDSICIGDITRFHITNKANIDQVSWNFGDGATSTVMDPIHQYAQPGSYTVKLTETFNGNNFTDSLPVVVYPLPYVNLGDSILLYSGTEINLHAGGGNKEYLWSNGSSDSIITVSDQGNYWAMVKDFHCCINYDTVFVKVFKYFIPNAFTPNGDGLNDQFRMIGLYHNIRFKMYIYNRWGQQVFESDDMEKGWDGTTNNEPSPPDTYAWVIFVDFLGQDIKTNGSIVLKGTVTLVK